MNWCVLVEGVRSKKVVAYNIFDNAVFWKAAQRIFKSSSTKEDIKYMLDNELHFIFGKDLVWKICARPVLAQESTTYISVYDQIAMNYDAFFDYIWEHQGELLIDDSDDDDERSESELELD